LAILVLPTTRWPDIQAKASDVLTAVNAMQEGEFRELNWK
jgi:hypothetical protein